MNEPLIWCMEPRRQKRRERRLKNERKNWVKPVKMNIARDEKASWYISQNRGKLILPQAEVIGLESIINVFVSNPFSSPGMPNHWLDHKHYHVASLRSWKFGKSDFGESISENGILLWISDRIHSSSFYTCCLFFRTVDRTRDHKCLRICREIIQFTD